MEFESDAGKHVGIAFLLNDMRIDKFLKISRLIKRRGVAAEACDSSRVLLNGKEAKPGARVKIGDIIELRFGSNPLKIQILNICETVRKEEASSLYTILPS